MESAPFKNRTDAGRRLAQKLIRYKDQSPVILALPRGGVPVAAEAAATLAAPLDLVLARKIGVPSQPELAMGAVADGAHPVVVRNEDVIGLAGVDAQTFEDVCRRELAEVERRRRAYLGDRLPLDIAGRVAIVIDDGVATGATTRAALRAARNRQPRRLVLAVPVAPTDTLELLRAEADDIVCLECHDAFGAIGYFYDDFAQVSDREVIDIIERLSQDPHVRIRPPR